MAVAVLCWAAPASATTYRDITITAEAVVGGNPVHGYTEFLVNITNSSLDQSHQVTLSLPRGQYGGGGAGNFLREIRRTVAVGPGATVRVSLLQPSLPMGGTDIGVQIDGRDQEQTVPFTRSHSALSSHVYRGHMPYGGTGSTIIPFILHSRGISRDIKDQADKALGPTVVGRPGLPGYPSPGPAPGTPGAGSPKADCEFVQAEANVDSWTTNWLGLTSFDAIMVTDADMRLMPAAVQSAIWQYVEIGGTLIVLGSWKAPEHWQSRQQTNRGFKTYFVGLGECIVTPQKDTAQWSAGQWQDLREAWRRTAKPWEQIRGVGEANSRFQIVEGAAIPLTGLTILMVLFCVGIGPVNFIILARRKRLIWMLWTIPAISLFTCVAVFAYATLGEGWRGLVKTETFTLLDEGTHRATTIGWTAYYAPMTPGGGLRFSYDTELWPQIADVGSGRYGRGYRPEPGTPKSVDWTTEQHLTSGWVTARVPTHFAVRKSEVRRERLSVRKDGKEGLTIVNGLGVQIRQLFLADEGGKMFYAESVPAGASAAAIPISQAYKEKLLELPTTSGADPSGAAPPGGAASPGARPAKELDRCQGEVTELRQIYANDWIVTVLWPGEQSNFSRNPHKYLRPNCYLAVLDDTPFLEDALGSIKGRLCRSVVYGIMGK